MQLMLFEHLKRQHTYLTFDEFLKIFSLLILHRNIISFDSRR